MSGKNNTKAEKTRAKEVTQALKSAGVPKAARDSVIKQATKTGVGLSKNEAQFLKNQAAALAGSKIKSAAAAKKFLGTVDYRKSSNAVQASQIIDAPSPGPIDYQYQEYVPGPPPPVRVPERDVVALVDQSIDAETIVNLLFENIGATELTKFVRHDTVEGINQYYDIISNLSDIKRRFDPSNLISLQKTTSSIFDIFPIKLQDKIPSDDYLIANNLSNYVYFDTNGDLIIEVVNIADSEIVEVEIDTSGTIYEVDEL
jgi:hypothetical protein